MRKNEAIISPVIEVIKTYVQAIALYARCLLSIIRIYLSGGAACHVLATGRARTATSPPSDSGVGFHAEVGQLGACFIEN
jgi:hypothetical protein